MQAHLFHRYKSISANTPLQIDNRNIAFFVDPIKDNAAFLTSANGMEWQLRFFIGSAFEQELVVYFDGDETPAKYHVGRACWLDNNGKKRNDSALLADASQFLRRSDTLTLSKCQEVTPNRSVLADRDGVAYFSDSSDQFKRIVLCQALAIAYAGVLADSMTRMTKNVQGNLTDEALALYEDILRFNAAHFFSLPVQLGRHELFAAWEVMRQHYHLQVLNDELTQQLSDVAALLREQREQQRADGEKAQRKLEESQRDAAETAARLRSAREGKIDRRLAVGFSLAGILFTALSLLQLTPAQFSSNFSAWKALIFKSAVAQSEINSEAPPSRAGSKQ